MRSPPVMIRFAPTDRCECPQKHQFLKTPYPTRAKVERIVARLDWHDGCFSPTEACLDERISGVYDQAECADWTMGSVLARAQAGRRFCARDRRPGMDRRPDPVASILATSRR